MDATPIYPSREKGSDFHRAIVSLDMLMRARGHTWIYGSDRAETTIVVINDRDSVDVPPSHRGRRVVQARMADYTRGRFG